MDVPFGLMMLVGKYVFLALIYGFLYWAFRGLFTQTALEARSQRPVGAPQPAAVPAPVLPPPPPAPLAAVAPVLAEVEPAAPPASAWVAEQPVASLKPALLVDDPGQSGLAAGQAIELTAAVTMGRAEDNGLVINDKFCSSHHAMIFLQAGQRVLRDRASTNGTYHNGQKVEGDVILVDGDKVGVGSVFFTYRAG